MGTKESTETAGKEIGSETKAPSLTLGERGPQGLRHLPTFSNDCYYQRSNCCWLCRLRVALSIRRDTER